MGKQKAILVVSFGTSFNSTREVTIDAIENEISAAFPDYAIYRAWTSKMIIAKVAKRDNVHIDNVKEAFIRMASDGIRQVIVQPTHVINGYENDRMKEDALSFQDQFDSIAFGDPLLTSEDDNESVVRIIADEFKDLGDADALVLMGHGADHYANSIYAAMDYLFKDRGHKNIFLGTVEAYPMLDSLVRLVSEYSPEKVVLSPFMIVAGDHANNDMAGDGEDSWASHFKKAGYHVECVLKGLGEYPGIRKMFVQHAQAAMEK